MSGTAAAAEVLAQAVLPAFDVQEIPFSRFGSWLALSPVVGEGRWADDVHLVSHRGGLHPVLRLTPMLGPDRVAARRIASPSRLAWQHEDRQVEVAFESTTAVRLRGRGLGLHVSAADPVLTPFSGPYFFVDPVDGSLVFTLYQTGRRYRLTVLAGSVEEVTGRERLGTGERGLLLPDSQHWEVVLEEYAGALPSYRSDQSFDQIVAAADGAFTEFLQSVAPWRAAAPAAALAAYVIWSAGVEPDGFLARPAVLMSKHWMNKVWSWDHCFTALALAGGQPGLAWDQFHVVFDHQAPGGALPDSITHSEVLFNFVKPPIHGWALRRLRAALPDLAPSVLADTYCRLERWTGFWLTFRRAPGSRLPHYQHGNDSGWDNATVFDGGGVVEAPDLAAYLVLQLRELGDLADLLGRPREAELWRAEAAAMCESLLQQLWTGAEFAAAAAGSTRLRTAGSLLGAMPILLGEDLPGPVREALAAQIRRHLTPHGLATELPTSPHYEADGYWRGPIWAPTTVLIEDGLRRAGEVELADEISDRFLALCERSGFAENFDALSGEGLRDRAYTWTAAAYLILAGSAHQRRTRLPEQAGATPVPPGPHQPRSRQPQVGISRRGRP